METNSFYLRWDWLLPLESRQPAYAAEDNHGKQMYLTLLRLLPRRNGDGQRTGEPRSESKSPRPDRVGE